MNHDHAESDTNRNPNDDAKPYAGAAHAKRDDGFVRHARALATGLTSQVDVWIKDNPYAALGMACAVGAAAGVVLSSRILRAVLTATATAAALEVTRSYLRPAPARER